eukprot:2418135-Amphidinium_carterae.1
MSPFRNPCLSTSEQHMYTFRPTSGAKLMEFFLLDWKAKMSLTPVLQASLRDNRSTMAIVGTWLDLLGQDPSYQCKLEVLWTLLGYIYDGERQHGKRVPIQTRHPRKHFSTSSAIWHLATACVAYVLIQNTLVDAHDSKWIPLRPQPTGTRLSRCQNRCLCGVDFVATRKRSRGH